MYVKAYERPQSLYREFERKAEDRRSTHYCPGCGHGNLHKYIAEAIDELGVQDRTIFISPVGCSVYGYQYFDVGNIQVAHGRAPAVATAMKRALPESLVVSYQGDGDLAAIGGNEIMHAANRGENLTVFFINNAIYGMTGGQMAPTTLLGQKTATTPFGRVLQSEGYPLRVGELLASLEGPSYIERVALYDTASRMKARRAVHKALKNQIEGRGFSLVEVLSPCPTGWGLSPNEACDWVREQLLPVYPLGVLRDQSEHREGWVRRRAIVTPAEIPHVLGLRETAETVTVPNRERISGANLHPRIKIAGFGGQGVLFLGKILAEAGMHEGWHVSWFPSYGPEMRGGTANCHVSLSDQPIGSPIVSDPTLLIALNRPSLERFEAEVVSGGTIIYDCSLIDVAPARPDIDAIALPATTLATDAGNARVANVVALGACLAKMGMLNREAVTHMLDDLSREKGKQEVNGRAFEAGYRFVLDSPG